ncbi:M28 family peptidase [Hymenobacter sp. HMF4947]|uniref:M28 family peptidase n=1 Tax=Hymenobacter ginkgonis TaxID=2682976 RepID=A0A7K1TD91_9BACT|nr:M28 family peptidase [Hymenobacter ginkgonis]MVN76365.1 M28 family peptidase [Hymenobacter ginkgonis]
MKYAFLLLAGLALPGAALAQTPMKVKTKIKGKTLPPTGARTLPSGGIAPHGPVPMPPMATDYAAQYATRYITQEKLRRDLGVLASDAYEGRETGTKGQKMAAAYISKQFAADSLTAPVTTNSPNPYLQTFNLERSAWQPGGTLTVGGKAYEWLKDFYAFGRSPFQQATAVQPVFVGYGIEQGAYSDYAGRDVQGKDLLVLLGEPHGADGKSVLSDDGSATKWAVDYRAKAALAAQKGARSVIFVDFSPKADFAKLVARLAPRVMQPIIAAADQAGGRAPSFFVSPAVGLKILGVNEAAISSYEAATAAAKKPVASKFKPTKFTISAPQERSTVSTENVLGFLPGTDKKDEILVVSAHYDHLGIIGGQVYNGADDDGSGTTGMLSVAEAFTKAAHAGHGPRRSILFLANTGEEKGLLGSQYYTDHPVFPLASTVADLNIDMIGRTDVAHEGKPDYVYVIGSDKLSSQLHAVMEAANRKYTNIDLDYRFNDPNDPNRFYYRSDHYNFAVHKIPVAFFFNGVHADYHEASDEIDKIQFDKMEARAKLVFFTAWELANRDERPVVDSNKP